MVFDVIAGLVALVLAAGIAARAAKHVMILHAKAPAAAQIRLAEQNTTDPQHDREAKRVMEIAAARCSMHFLTERNLSTLRVGPEIVSILLDNNAAIHGALEKRSEEHTSELQPH